MKKFMASGIFGLSLLAGAAHSEIQVNTPSKAQDRVNINIPTDKVTVEDATTFINFLSATIHEGTNEVLLADALANVEVPPEFKPLVDKILASRDALATVECSGRKCKITSKGQALDFKIDGLTLPVLGTPAVSLSKTITVYAQVAEDNQKAELCRIDGVAVKVSILKPNVDGGLIEIENGAIKTLMIDAGAGGSYPSKACDFISTAGTAH